MLEHDVGDLDAAEQQRQEAQVGDQPIGRERRRLAAGVTQHDVDEADGAGGKQRDLDRPAQHGIEAGDGADLRLDGVARAVRRGQPGNRQQGDHTGKHDDADGDAETLQASGRSHRGRIRMSKAGFRAQL